MPPRTSVLGLCPEILAEFTKSVGKVKDLKALSLVHRSFTGHCQKHLFERLDVTSHNRRLHIAYETIEKDSWKVDYVRWLFVRFDELDEFNPLSDSRFVSLVQLMPNATRPPSTLHLANLAELIDITTPSPLPMERIFTTGICRALTCLIVHNTQLPDAAISRCSQLKELSLSEVRRDNALSNDPGEKRTSDPEPHIEKLDYTSSTEMIKRLIEVHGPLPPVASLSALRVLSLVPEHEEDMALAQPILDVAHDSLEELYLQDTTDDSGKSCLLDRTTLTNSYADYDFKQLLLANLLNFQRLSHLRLVDLRCTVYDSDPNGAQVVHDMQVMLSRLPVSNSLATFKYRVQVFGRPPYTIAMLQSWQGLAKEVIRVAGARPFRLSLEMDTGFEDTEAEDSPLREDARLHSERVTLFSHVRHEMRHLEAHKNIKWVFQNTIDGYR
jgi:hypothetical protein